MFSGLVHPLPSLPAQARGAPCRHPLLSPLGSLPKLGVLVFSVLQLCAMAWQGLLGSPIFPRHMVRLIQAGCEAWVSHWDVLG